MASQLNRMDEIQHRLVRLETQNRRFKQLAAILLIVAAMLFVMGQTAPVKKTVEAQEFILRDASGKVRARLSMISPKGAMPGSAPIPQFALIDEKGNERIRLFISGTDSWGISGLYLQDNQGRDRASFAQGSALGSMLVQQDEKGQVKTRIIDGEVLAVNEVSSLKMNSYEFNLNSTGGTRARLFMSEKHTENVTLPGMDKPVPMTLNPMPMFALYDDKGRARVVIDGEGYVKGGTLAVSDADGNLLGTLSGISGYGATLGLVNGKGELRAWLEPGHLQLTDDNGFKAGIGVEKNLVTVRTGETHQTSAASVMLFDKNGTVLWKAP